MIKHTLKIEILALRVKNGMTAAFFIVCIYRPPNNNADVLYQDMDCIEMVIEELTKTKRLYMLIGDFNINNVNMHRKMDLMLKKYSAKQLITKNTRTNAILDLMITNKKEICTDTRVEDLHIADHLATFTSLKMVKAPPLKQTITYKDYTAFNKADISIDV